MKRKQVEAKGAIVARGEARKAGKPVVGGKPSANGSQREGSLATIIDSFLLAGGRTIKEIACEATKKAGQAAMGKDMQANVRARMVSYRRKGWQIKKCTENHVKLLARKA